MQSDWLSFYVNVYNVNFAELNVLLLLFLQKYTPSPPHGGLPTDHSLVITVGNELTGLSQSTEAEIPYGR